MMVRRVVSCAVAMVFLFKGGGYGEAGEWW